VAADSGRLDAKRDHTLLGKERHDIGRTDGELLSVAYPSRALRNDQYLYIRNFESHRWPVGNPEYGLLNCDDSPTKTFLTNLTHDPAEKKWYDMSFGKRPKEQLFDMQNDPDCVEDLAGDPALAETVNKLWLQLKTELKAQGDPRVLGEGEIFDYYPNCRIDRQQKLYGKPDYDPVQMFQEKFGNQSPD